MAFRFNHSERCRWVAKGDAQLKAWKDLADFLNLWLIIVSLYPLSFFSGNRPLKWDSKHDMILSLVAWVEHGEKPKEIIGGSYNSRSKVLPIAANSTGASDLKYLPTYFESNKYGIINTRKLCPYPQQAIYKGGPINGTKSYKSFECK